MDYRISDWKSKYKSQIATPDAAVRLLRRGQRILIGSGAAEPSALVEALVGAADHFADNEIVHLLTLGPAPYVQPGLEGRFRHTAFFIGANVRAAVQEGRADFMPVFLSEIPELIGSRRVRIDAVLIQVSPPDRHGYVSLGVSVDIVRAAVESADVIIAEVNPLMPRTLGQSFLHVSRVAALVPVEHELPELLIEPENEVHREIGKNVASLIQDGATIQTGIGRIPHAIMQNLKDRSDLGMHTEMLSDSVIDLVECGALSGRVKTLLPGKIVTSFVMGTRRLYEWVHENPAVELRPSDFTNNPDVIARNDDMIAVNSALAIDLTGQVAADTLMGRFFSGIGGQVDFVRGAAKSQRGKSIIALPSTAKGGQASRILGALEAGAGVVTSRGDVRYVVTEYGVADLWGKSVRQRSLALIEIAHPDFRSELLSAAKERRYVFPDQKSPRAVYLGAAEVTHVTLGGQELTVRPLKASDEEALQDFFYSLSQESAYARFFAYKNVFPHGEMQALVDLDCEHNMALVVVSEQGASSELVGMARYDVDPATRLAEIAFVVRDAWQGKGVGTLLMQRMSAIAKARGLAGFTADVLATNALMLSVFHQSGLTVTSKLTGGVYHLTLRFARPSDIIVPLARGA